MASNQPQAMQWALTTVHAASIKCLGSRCLLTSDPVSNGLAPPIAPQPFTPSTSNFFTPSHTFHLPQDDDIRLLPLLGRLGRLGLRSVLRLHGHVRLHGVHGLQP
mmetsp:Transcript_12039/g.25875  ORF Transcript_12039/g.25875 Transcript_12039/m.25875 type:complete len:105 (-) Transcript_12039:215-529(-)